MKLPSSTFSVIDWSGVPPTEHDGEKGISFWRTVSSGDLRLRVVEYTPGFHADHWCDKGHVIFVLEGEIDIELKDGRNVPLRAGMSCHVSDFGDASHRAASRSGAKLFIVD